MTARLLSGGDSMRYRHLTYPAYRVFFTDPPPDNVVVAGIETDGIPTGMGFCRLSPDYFEIGSLYSMLASLGIDDRAAILAVLMDEAARRGLGRGVFSPTLAQGDQATTALLAAAGWTGPRIRTVVARATTQAMLTLPFIHRGMIAPGYAVCPWGELPAGARAQLRERIDSIAPEIRIYIDPFAIEARADPVHSVALLEKGRIIAWHLPEQIEDQLMRWTCSAGLPEARGISIFMLWVHALHRQQEAGIAELVWGVPMILARMVRFVEQRLRPIASSLSYGASFDFHARATP
ncbi:MAG: hypothetical protein V4574_02005 [Pseudomonadota bacterium]